MKSKKIIIYVYAIIFCNLSFSQSYKTELKKLNDFLVTFDNGYYGYLEIKDGYLYDRFRDGNNYCKAKVSDIDKAYEKETKRKVELNCKSTDNCLFSTFTNQNYNSFSFSQSTDFNTTELISLLNNLIDSYNGKSVSTTTNSTTTTSTNTSNNKDALKKLNDYLKTFDNGYYGYFEVKDGYIYDRFKAGKYNKFKMEDIEGAVIQENYQRVIFKCKSGNCISTDWKENGKEDYTQFTTGNVFNYQELATLLNNFRDAYSDNKQTSSTNPIVSNNKSREQLANERKKTENVISKKAVNDENEDWDALESSAVTLNKSVKEAEAAATNKKYQIPLQKLNEYLRIFNPETYDKVVVKGDSVFFYFKAFSMKYASSISIKTLKQNTIISKATFAGQDEIKIFCKGDVKCFYSTYSKGNADHFRFFSNTIKDLTKMEQLVKDFVKALQ